MNILLWVFQGLLALLFLATGTMLLITPRDKITERAAWTEAFSPGFVKLVGGLEVLGAVGLVVPMATDILPWLTPLAAVGLGLLMAGAVVTHLRHREYPNALLPLAVSLLAAFIVYGRVSAVAVL
ncbi:DoxX family protein [soil metagenome]